MKYTKRSERGRGGFGVVDEVIGDDNLLYARKTLQVPQQLDAAGVRRRFEREVRFQSSISHPHVVHIFEHDLQSDPPWFVMPLAERSLLDEIAADRTLGGAPQVALFHILSGLEEIHRRGFCHRDLKPGNVLRFTASSGEAMYALSDFGLMAVGEDASSTLTPTGAGGGTPLYQAPECATNFHRATERSDIYSFGAILYDIFAPNPRRLPHDELSAPGDVGRVIEKCTKRNSHRRYKNVTEVRDALFAALSTFVFSFQSNEEQEVVGLLTARIPLSPERWDKIFDFIDDQMQAGRAVGNVFRALGHDHIQQLFTSDSDLMIALGKFYAAHCRDGTFGFEYCDVLASKAETFFTLGDIALKAEIAVALLRLGTSHNRWFVEHKFLGMASPSCDDALADRIAVEIEVLGIDFRREFRHLQASVNAGEQQLHPTLRARLAA